MSNKKNTTQENVSQDELKPTARPNAKAIRQAIADKFIVPGDQLEAIALLGEIDCTYTPEDNVKLYAVRHIDEIVFIEDITSDMQLHKNYDLRMNKQDFLCLVETVEIEETLPLEEGQTEPTTETYMEIGIYKTPDIHKFLEDKAAALDQSWEDFLS